jgi:protein-L-isoaspartate(D-aspartate) O-methyltransferase
MVARKIRLIMELRRAGISDPRVLAAMERIPREIFVPVLFRDQAYENVALPIGSGQTISQPAVVAMMTEALQVGDRHKVLEIGTGSGYQTAVLAKLCRRVFSVERHHGLLREAEKRFFELRLNNITCRYGDGSRGWPEQGPFDRIIVTAAAPELPPGLAETLAPEGIIVAPIGEERRDQELVRVRRTETGLESENLGPVRFVPLVAGLPRHNEAGGGTLGSDEPGNEGSA